MKKAFSVMMVVITVLMAVSLVGRLHAGVSSAAASAVFNSPNMPFPLAKVAPAGTPLAKDRDIASPGGQNNVLQFAARGHVLGFQPTKAYFASLDHALSVEFLGTKGVMPTTAEPLPGVGTGSKVSTLRRVLYQSLWEGISLTYESAKEGITESTYQISPGADVAQIRLRYNVPVTVQDDGSLRFPFNRGYFTESKPIAWQQVNGKRMPVAVAFTLSGDEIGFSVGEYNPREPLIIDPTYTWHTFYGSSSKDYGWGIAVDSSGNIYVTGYSDDSWGFPLNAHSGSQDLFVLKLNAAGAYQWHTFYGSSNPASGWTSASIAVDVNGNVYVAGESSSSWGTPLNLHSGNSDVFIVKLNGDGAYQWHTFYGSSGQDTRSAIAVDVNGNVYVAGESSSSWGTPLHAKSPSQNLFVLKLNGYGAYQWHTFYGLSDGEYGSGIAVDASGNVYVTAGSSAAWGTPLNPHSGNTDVLVLKLNGYGTYQWHTFLGSGGYDAGYAIAVDTRGNAYITGTLNRNLAILKLNAGGAYQWHTFFGSSDYCSGYGIALDASENIYVTGESWAAWRSPLNAYTGDADIFVLKLNANGTYQWHTFYGSSAGDDWGAAIAVDASGNVYVTGASSAAWGSPLNAHAGDYDLFVLTIADPSSPTPNPPAITSLSPVSGPVGTVVTITGNYFGSTQGTVRFNGTAVTSYTSWSNTSIKCAVPSGATTGPVTVQTSAGTSAGVTFTVTTPNPPAITSLSPVSGPVGTVVTITGNYFGSTQGTSTLTFNGWPVTPASWSNTSITCRVPDGAPPISGLLRVTTSAGTSAGMTFTVTP